ncbi:MAG TPA: glycosyltransferase family 39 protein [Ignavibacteriaceae bacterium]|nr:glycosyltransferase family 39 protein [Ignavibacteriaceae bacterium]
MKKLLKFLASKIKYILLFYVFIQLTLILTLETNYRSDALYYFKLAQECIEQSEFYPAKQHLYEDYIVAPLYINTLIIFLTIYNSTIIISFFNLAVILLQIMLLYKITKRIFSEDIARLTILLFILYINTLGLLPQNYTELFFLLLITFSTYFYLLHKNIYLIISGIFLGGAIAVRPLGWALLLAFISIQIFTSIKNKKILFNYFYIYSGTLLFIILFGGFTYSHFGKFEFTSTTGPINLLLGSNDDATGGFNSLVLENGKAGYIEDTEALTYIQKGEFYQNRAVDWIIYNPTKWLSLAPLKLLHSYGWDDISLSSLMGFDETNFLKVIRILFSEGDSSKALPNSNLADQTLYFSVLIVSHLYYYLLLLAIAFGIYNLFKKKLNMDLNSLILLFVVFATLMIMITVGSPRYKYPMIILLLPFAASYIDMKFGLTKQKNVNA